MLKDAQGVAVTGATREAVEHYDAAVRAFALAYGDPLAAFDAARAAAPDFVMAHLGKAWVFALANDAILVKHGSALLAHVGDRALNEREAAHAAALAHAIEGHRSAAARILDRYLMRQPLDLMAHYAGLLLDAFNGRFHLVRDRSARALPFWSPAQPGYGILLSFYGFGLEEAGNYERAEVTARAAAALEPYGYWPHHAVSHVLEMTGRPESGLAWMAEREPLWSGKDNANRVHIWWHKALFHVELGQYDAALGIYDGPVVSTQRPAGISLTNASALLWRLEMLGCGAGERWQSLATLWRDHADGRLCVFADLHAGMAALGAGDDAEVDRLRGAMCVTAAGKSEQAGVYRDVGLPVLDGLTAFRRGAYADAVEALFPVRPDLIRIGGSHAQRDVIDWTLNEAATRAGMRDVAMALANERLAMRPESEPNRRFMKLAEAIAA